MLEGNPILSCEAGDDFGFKCTLPAEFPHEAILLSTEYKETIRQYTHQYGFLIFEGQGIDIDPKCLSHKTVAMKKLERNLFWHIDRKSILTLYYPNASWRPGDFIFGKKSGVISSLKDMLKNHNACFDSEIKTKLEFIINAVDLRCFIDINYAIAELSCMNSNLKYNALIETLLSIQINHYPAFYRFPIVSGKTQMIFCTDSVDADVCHARLRNTMSTDSSEAMDYVTLPDAHVLTYPS